MQHQFTLHFIFVISNFSFPPIHRHIANISLPVHSPKDGMCDGCGSKKYTEWDYKAKKCPQCEDWVEWS